MFKKVNESAESKNLFYAKKIVPDVLLTKSRAYRGGGCPETEYDKTYGKHLDKPRDKFFKVSSLPSGKEKPYADCLDNISKGTNKASMNIQGYLGKILFNFKDIFPKMNTSLRILRKMIIFLIS